MNDESKNIKTTPHEIKVTVSGAGVLHVKSADLVKTEQAKSQIRALGELKKKGFLTPA